jgi:hypothetical protein
VQTANTKLIEDKILSMQMQLEEHVANLTRGQFFYTISLKMHSHNRLTFLYSFVIELETRFVQQLNTPSGNDFKKPETGNLRAKPPTRTGGGYRAPAPPSRDGANV